MAMDPFFAALADFRQWADTTQRKLAGDPAADAGELLTLFDLMEADLGMERPGDLGEGDLEELLLRIYPREIIVANRADTGDTVPAVRDFLAYLTERGEMPDGTARALESELDLVAPQFADAMVNEPEWDLFDEEDPGLDIKEAFGLPDQMPPMRLPPAAELAATARRAPMMAHLLALAEWAGKGRAVNENAELAGGDAAEAAAALGVDVPYLGYLLWLALDTGFIELDDDETHAAGGADAQAWQASDDDEALDIWETVFAFVLDALDVTASLDPRRSRDLDFSGHGAGLAITLFLTRAEGLPVAEASEVIKDTSAGELPPDQAAKAWQSWIRAHGDPARLLLDRMTQLGAVEVYGSDGELARLTPLGLAAMRTLLIRHGVEIPLLRSADQMTAADLLAMADGVSEEEFEAESAAWLAHRTPESAARELLSAGAGSDPASRMLAVAVVTGLGAPAEPAWREALSRLELRGYAKVALATLAGDDPEDPARPEFELAEDELAWALIDTLVTDGWGDLDDDAEHDPQALAELLREAIPPGRELVGFEMMARAPHPDAPNVLTMIGRHHPDKKVAKLARKSAYKAASRQAARGR
jgi:hypothetical protein